MDFVTTLPRLEDSIEKTVLPIITVSDTFWRGGELNSISRSKTINEPIETTSKQSQILKIHNILLLSKNKNLLQRKTPISSKKLQ